MFPSTRSGQFLIFVFCLVICFGSSLSLPSNQQGFRFVRSADGDRRMRYGQKREPKFYTTRFGKRTSGVNNAEVPDDVSGMFERDLKAVSAPGAVMAFPLGRPPSEMARNVEGHDEFGVPVSCVYSGIRTFYICDKEEPWSSTNL